ncbi:MAG: tRNA (adenosine(37)-N6)-dimethylallyltransferase MiaA [Clostridiales bacterium]|nr:tRNA (adenosine(37)-N6)-dimethylallyltransferase MiaA [Clostridiales bacterium]
MDKPLVIILGPTAVGKTKISIQLAGLLNAEIISADSMQVYKYMDIGTAKPSKDEMQGIKHHLIDVVYPDEEFSVALYRKLAGEKIDDILSRHKLPIVVGGTGLYIKSLTHNLNFAGVVCDKPYREELQKAAKLYGNEYVHNMLKDKDPDSFKRLHANDLKRVIRALEVFKLTGKTMPDYRSQTKLAPGEYDTCVVGLMMDRKKLYERINSRADKMIEQGLVDEVKRLLDMGYSRDLTSMQGLGYKEIIPYLFGECSLDDAVYKLKECTRHFAKRQITWFKREDLIYWIDVDDFTDENSIVQNIADYVAGKLNLV